MSNFSSPVEIFPVSIVVPLFNGAKYVLETLQSVVNQNVRPVEILVVDDGSDDGGPELVTEWARQKGHSVELLPGSHRGAAHTRNRGIEAARGDFVVLLDQDDLWTPDALRHHCTAWEDQPDLEGTWGCIRLFLEPGLERPNWCRPEMMGRDLPGSILSALLLRREVFKRLDGFDESHPVCNDVAFFVRMREAQTKIFRLPQLTVWKRIHAQNHSSQVVAHHADILQVLRAKIHRQRQQN